MSTDWRETLIPDAFEKYDECDGCEVVIHGPQRANSPGGCHVTFCDDHEDDW